jgi:hypothetical protein
MELFVISKDVELVIEDSLVGNELVVTFEDSASVEVGGIVLEVELAVLELL